MFVTRDRVLMLPLVNPQVTAGINDLKNPIIDSRVWITTVLLLLIIKHYYDYLSISMVLFYKKQYVPVFVYMSEHKGTAVFGELMLFSTLLELCVL